MNNKKIKVVELLSATNVIDMTTKINRALDNGFEINGEITIQCSRADFSPTMMYNVLMVKYETT